MLMEGVQETDKANSTFQTANREVENVECIVFSFVCIEDLLVHTWFGIGENIAVALLLDTSLGDRCILWISSSEEIRPLAFKANGVNYKKDGDK